MSQRPNKNCFRPLVTFLEDRTVPAPLTAVPVLSSLPGSTHTIYLDFDGNPAFKWVGNLPDTTKGVDYEDVTLTPAFSLDADATSFSQNDLNVMTEIWARVAEDYSPFNVNVTTIKPANFNKGSAIQVVIGGDGAWLGKYGGVAWHNSFSDTNDASTTVFVFPINKNNVPGDIAKAVSHEAGHTFGLLHKSDYVAGRITLEYSVGEGGWAPILGSYGETLSTFNTGLVGGQSYKKPDGNGGFLKDAMGKELVFYTDITTQDDLLELSKVKVLGLKNDDYLIPTALDVSGRTRSKSGLITTVNDTDTFFFSTGAGQITATVTGAALATKLLREKDAGAAQAAGANVDAVLELLNSSGSVIMTANPIDSLNATITTTLAAGTYQLRVSTSGGAARGAVGSYKLTVDTPVVTGPYVVSHSPTGSVSTSPSSIQLAFDQVMNTSSFSVASDVVSFTGPSGNELGQITGFNWLDNKTLRINFNARTASGAYSLVVGPAINSAGGQAMDQNQNGTLGEATADRYTAAFTIAVSAVPDRFESNDSFATASAFGTTGDRVEENLSVHATGNDDYYRFTAIATGSTTVRLKFANAQGNLDLRIYDGSQTLIGSSLTTGDTETVTFAITQGSNYYIRVNGASGATNQKYRLELDVPNGVGDRFEGNNSAATATNIGTLGDILLTGLSLHTSSDEDFYRFHASSGLFEFRINFRHDMGDIDFELLNSSGTVVNSSRGYTDQESFIALLLITDTYYLHVYGEANSEYELYVDGPGGFRDRYEANGTLAYDANNTLATATNLGTVSAFTATNLSINVPGDDDFYRFVAAVSGPLDISLMRGNEDVYLPPALDVLNSAGTLISRSTVNRAVQNVLLQAVAGQTYYIHAYGGDDYTLIIGGTGTPADRFAGNSSFDSAADLGTVTTRGEGSLTLERPLQNDYYRFVAANSGFTTISLNAAQVETLLSEGNDRRITIDILLYDANRQLIGQSNILGPETTFGFAATAGATYFVVARGSIDADTVDQYSLHIAGAAATSPTPIAPPANPVPNSPTPVNPIPVSPPSATPLPTLSREYAVGAGAGSGVVRFFNSDGSSRFDITPFGAGFAGGVRTAAADFNRDGIADLVVGTGPGIATRVLVLDGVNQSVLFTVDPFEASFVGGVFVASGDVTGDGIADLVITPDEGGGPRVRIFSGDGFGLIADFLGIDDPNFRGGARAAIGDLNGDKIGDLIVAAGFGGGPRVAGFDGRTLSQDDKQKLFGDFLAFEEGLRNGIFVASGDLDGDGKAELIAGGGPGGGPRVSSFAGTSLVSGTTPERVVDFFAGDPNNRGGVRVSVKSLDGDEKADLVIGAGPGAGSRVTTYAGKNLGANLTPAELSSFDGFPEFSGGVFVG